jgi:hypothetical protein
MEISGGIERDDSPESVVEVEPLRLCPEGSRGFPVPGLRGEESWEALRVPDGPTQEIGEHSRLDSGVLGTFDGTSCVNSTVGCGGSNSSIALGGPFIERVVSWASLTDNCLGQMHDSVDSTPVEISTPLCTGLNESMGPESSCSTVGHVRLTKFCKSPTAECKMMGMLLPTLQQAVKWPRLVREGDGESVSRDLRIDQVLDCRDRIDMLKTVS